MPAMSYHVSPLPGINLDLVALDLTGLDHGRTCPWIACGRETCSGNEAVYRGCNLARCSTHSQAGPRSRRKSPRMQSLLHALKSTPVATVWTDFLETNHSRKYNKPKPAGSTVDGKETFRWVLGHNLLPQHQRSTRIRGNES